MPAPITPAALCALVAERGRGAAGFYDISGTDGGGLISFTPHSGSTATGAASGEAPTNSRPRPASEHRASGAVVHHGASTQGAVSRQAPTSLRPALVIDGQRNPASVTFREPSRSQGRVQGTTPAPAQFPAPDCRDASGGDDSFLHAVEV